MTKTVLGTYVPILYSCSGIIKLYEIAETPTMQALALAFAMMGWPVFPCKMDKTPIVDPLLGFTRGFKDATTDLKRIAKAWHKYPNAAIGFAILPRIVVIDLDVLKDSNKVPIKKEDGTTISPGLKSYQELIINLDLPGGCLNTLTVDTQSGGRQLYYLLPDGYQSFNHTAALPGLDIKGYGGYVILPNSKGIHGSYRFRRLTAILPIPIELLKWVMQLKRKEPEKKEFIIPAVHEISDIRILEFVEEIMPAWNLAIEKHMGNEFRLAIAGTLYHSGWPETKAQQVMSLIIAKSEIKGISDKHAVRYTYANGNAGKPVYGFSTLEKLIEEIEGVK